MRFSPLKKEKWSLMVSEITDLVYVEGECSNTKNHQQKRLPTVVIECRPST